MPHRNRTGMSSCIVCSCGNVPVLILSEATYCCASFNGGLLSDTINGLFCSFAEPLGSKRVQREGN